VARKVVVCSQGRTCESIWKGGQQKPFLIWPPSSHGVTWLSSRWPSDSELRPQRLQTLTDIDNWKHNILRVILSSELQWYFFTTPVVWWKGLLLPQNTSKPMKFRSDSLVSRKRRSRVHLGTCNSEL
jgi:hypothetical protein